MLNIVFMKKGTIEFEVGGGLITFIHGEYVWIHQTC
jgi:hypothetical protein